MGLPVSRIRHFFQHTLWEPREGLQNWWFAGLQITVLAIQGLIRKKSLVRISALAYSTILALIPLLALLFAIFKGLGIQRLLAAHFLPRLAGGSQEMARQILNYIETTKATSLGIFGVVWLLVALVLVMTNVEQAFNDVWGVSQTRPWSRKLSDYLSIFLLFPILMAVAVSLTTTVQSNLQLHQFFRGFLPEVFYSAYTYLITFLIMWVAFVFIYLVMPNTRVNFLSALIGGVVGGTLWQIAQWLFLWFQSTATYYNAIYGALYQLLFLVIWVFWSWLVVLFGSEVAFAHQNLPRLIKACRRPQRPGQLVDEYLGLAMLVAIGARFYREEDPLTLSELEQLFSLEPETTRRLVSALQRSGLVVAAANRDNEKPSNYLPRRPLDRVLAIEVLDDLRQLRWAALSPNLPPEENPVGRLARLLEAGSRTRSATLSVKDLIDQQIIKLPLLAEPVRQAAPDLTQRDYG